MSSTTSSDTTETTTYQCSDCLNLFEMVFSFWDDEEEDVPEL
jgi:hypothetical protein